MTISTHNLIQHESGALTSAEPPEAARPTFLRGLDQLISGDVDEACLLQQMPWNSKAPPAAAEFWIELVATRRHRRRDRNRTLGLTSKRELARYRNANCRRGPISAKPAFTYKAKPGLRHIGWLGAANSS